MVIILCTSLPLCKYDWLCIHMYVYYGMPLLYTFWLGVRLGQTRQEVLYASTLSPRLKTHNSKVCGWAGGRIPVSQYEPEFKSTIIRSIRSYSKLFFCSFCILGLLRFVTYLAHTPHCLCSWNDMIKSQKTNNRIAMLLFFQIQIRATWLLVIMERGKTAEVFQRLPIFQTLIDCYWCQLSR